jgi:hypothetical protein
VHHAVRFSGKNHGSHEETLKSLGECTEPDMPPTGVKFNRNRYANFIIACLSGLNGVTIMAFQDKHFEKLTVILVRAASIFSVRHYFEIRRKF